MKLRNKVEIKPRGSTQTYKKEFSLLNYKVPVNQKYMVLESDINCLSKAIHVVNFDFKNEYTVGRRVTNDITVSDISVSRAQSSIFLKNGKVYVQDMDSKFGTFVKIQGMYEIGKYAGNEIIPIQIEKKCFFIRPALLHRYQRRSDVPG